MSALESTSTKIDFEIHKLFYDQCVKDILVIAHNKSAKRASSAIAEYMAKINIEVEKYNSDVKAILESCGFEPPSQCIQKIALSESAKNMQYFYQHTQRDDKYILEKLNFLYNLSLKNNTKNIILRIHLARYLQIDLSKFDEYYNMYNLINIGKTSPLYFCVPTHNKNENLFKYTDKTHMTLGYIAKLFQTHTTEFKFFVENTEFYDRHEYKLMQLPNSIVFNHDGYNYTVRFNCNMSRNDIDKRTASFHIGNPVMYKTRPGDKTIEKEMNYIFLNDDSHGRYCDFTKKYYGRNFVVLTNDFEYYFDTFEKDTNASQQMKALVEKFTASNCGLSFFHYFLTKLPIEKQLLYVTTFFTRQSVWRDY